MVSEEGVKKALEDIEALKRDLSQLKTEHAAVVKQLKQETLNLKRLEAALKINADSATFCEIVDRQMPHKQLIRIEVLADASSARAKLLSSTKPSNISEEFSTKWKNTLLDLGADLMNC